MPAICIFHKSSICICILKYTKMLPRKIKIFHDMSFKPLQYENIWAFSELKNMLSLGAWKVTLEERCLSCSLSLGMTEVPGIPCGLPKPGAISEFIAGVTPER